MNVQAEISRITKGILRGELTTKDYPPEYDEKILLVLDIAKQKAIKDGNVARVKTIHNAKSVILQRNISTSNQTTNRPKSILQIRKKTMFPQTSRSTPVSSKDTKELEKTMEKIKKGEHFDDTDYENLPDLVHYSKAQADSLSSQRRYIEAQEIEDIGKRAQELVPLQLEREKYKKRDEILSQRIANYEDNLADDTKSYEDKKMKEEEERKYFLNKENERFQKELEEFDKITDGEIPPQFRNYSSRLLNLQKLEQYLAKARRFAEANIAFTEAKQLEKIETERNIENWKQHRSNLRKKLEQEHQQRVEIILGRKEADEIKRMQTKSYKEENHEKVIQNLRGEQYKNANDSMRKKSLAANSTPSSYTSRSMMTTPRVRQRPIPRSSIVVWSTPKRRHQTNPPTPLLDRK